MDIPADTKQIVTPSGKHTILVRSYLTGKDRRDHRRLIWRLAEEEKNDKVEALEESENALIAAIVIDVDGSKENMLERILQMESQDYDFVINLTVKITKRTAIDATEDDDEDKKKET